MISFTTRSALRSAATPELYKIRTESTKNRKSVRTDPKKSASGKQKEEVSSAKYVRKARKTGNQYVQNRKSQFQGNRKKGEVLQNTYGKHEKQEISTYRPGKVSFREAESREKFCKIRTESTKNRESVRTVRKYGDFMPCGTEIAAVSRRICLQGADISMLLIAREIMSMPG